MYSSKASIRPWFFSLWLIPIYLTSCMVTDPNTRVYIASRPASLTEPNEYPHTIGIEELKLTIKSYNDIEVDPEQLRLETSDPARLKDHAKGQAKQEFKVLVGYLPSEDGFRLDPNQVYLKLDGDSYRATVKNSWLNEADNNSENVLHMGHYCGPHVTGFSLPIPSNAKLYQTTDYWHCYQLLFPRKVPHPSEGFAISVDGFEKDGEHYDVPDILFEGYVRKEKSVHFSFTGPYYRKVTQEKM